MVKPLNNMCFSNMKPAFNDHESLTAIEMIGKFYSKLNEIIDEYTSFTESIKQYIDTFSNVTNQNADTFKLSISQKFQDFIDVVDLRLKSMDSEIDKSIISIRNNMYNEIKKITSEMNEAGEISEAIMDALGGYSNALNELKNQLDGLNLNYLSSGVGQPISKGTLQRIIYVVQSFLDHQLDLGYAHKVSANPKDDVDYHDSAWVLNKEVTKIIGGNQYGCLGYACNCTTFVLHCLLGIPYEASRYVHTTSSKHNVGYAGYSANIWNEPITISNFDLYYNTLRMWQRFKELGQGRTVNADYSNVSAGDIVWMAPKDLDEDGTITEEDISHVGIVLSTSGLYTNPDDKLTPCILIAECTSSKHSIQCKWYTPYDLNKFGVKWVAKPNYQYTNDVESSIILKLNNGYANYTFEKNFNLKNGDIITIDFDFRPNAANQYVFITGLCDEIGKHVQLRAGSRLKSITDCVPVGSSKHITFTTSFLLSNEGTGEYEVLPDGTQKETTFIKTHEPVMINGIAIRVLNGTGNETISNFKIYKGLPSVEKVKMFEPKSLDELKVSLETLLFDYVSKEYTDVLNVNVRPAGTIKDGDDFLFYSGVPFTFNVHAHQSEINKYLVAKTFYRAEEITMVWNTKTDGWKITKNTL